MKQINALKLTIAAAFVAALGMGCASTGYARYDADADRDTGVGVSAGAEVGADTDTVRADLDADLDTDLDTDMEYRSSRNMYRGDTHATMTEEEGSARITESALGFAEETRAEWVNKFPFYDNKWRIRTIETYTFAPPEEVDLSRTFDTDLTPGSPFVEAAGGAGAGRVIQHTVNPR